VSGYSFQTPLFSLEAMGLIADRSEGIPRNINNICFTALTLGSDMKQSTIQRGLIFDALKELDLSKTGSDEAAKVSVGQEVFTSTTNMVKASPGRFLLRPGFAAVVLLVLASVWWVGDRFHKMSEIHASSAGVASMSASPSPSALVEKEDLQNSRSRSEDVETNGVAIPPVDPPVVEKVTAAETPAPESRNDKQQSEAATDDPAKLWAQVKMSDSNAEVKLARMFMEGTGVDQNCAQAQLLLRDASRKGNAEASSLLSDHTCR
jgi:hypothetical protein